MIHFLDVSKYYGNHLVFDQINCHIETTSFNYLIGANGTGKSTFFKLILKQKIPDGGEILFFQRSLGVLKKTSLEEHRRHIGTIEQEHRFLRQENVETNLMLPFIIAGQKTPENTIKMRALAEQLGVANFLKKTIDDLSIGERQLVSVVRALVHEPGLILADDPTQYLSEDSAKGVIKLLREAYLKGATVILASRNLSEIYPDSRLFLIQHYQLQEVSTGNLEKIASIPPE